MKCSLCSGVAVIGGPFLCKAHFIQEFERRVQDTIKRFNLLNHSQKVMVACSGGKDSTVLLYLLKKFGYSVEAMCIDEGIAGYRDESLSFLRSFCKSQKIKLNEVSFDSALGFPLDSMVSRTKKSPCHVCGVFRRNLLNKHSRSFDAVATGHNMDDEAQSIMMNLLLHNKSILPRLGPKTGTTENKKFVQRVKPLYLCKEKEVMAYSYLKGLLDDFKECPNIQKSFRASVRDFLNDYEARNKGFKKKLVVSFLNALPYLRNTNEDGSSLYACSVCGEPSSSEICMSCLLQKEISRGF